MTKRVKDLVIRDGDSGLESIIRQLSDLSKPDPDDEDFVLPTKYARRKLLDTVESTVHAMMWSRCRMPEGSVMTDDAGGIRIEWRNDLDFCVTLAIGKDKEAKSYVFVKLTAGDPGSVNETVLPIRLAFHLKRL